MSDRSRSTLTGLQGGEELSFKPCASLVDCCQVRLSIFKGGDHQEITGQPSPVRGVGAVSPELDRAARQAISQLAGHARIRASGADCGKSLVISRMATKSLLAEESVSENSP